jgi:hypothetical protein
MMVGDCRVNNLLPFVVLRNFRLQRNMRGYMDTRDMLGIERRPLQSRLDYPLSNQIEKSSLENMV